MFEIIEKQLNLKNNKPIKTKNTKDMEQNINIADILKDKPNGTNLWSMIIGKCTLQCVDNDSKYPVRVESNTGIPGTYNCKGRHLVGIEDSECILFPSKEMRDWNKFAWKKGDVLSNDCGFQCIFKEWASDDYTMFNGRYSNSREGYEDVFNAETAKFDKISNDTAYDYIREIERKLGGKLNLETLEIEQPEFKDGDILHSDETSYSDETIFIAKISDRIIRTYAYLDLSDNCLLFRDDSFDESENCKIRHATDSEKQQLFDSLAKEGKTWDAEKKQIVDLPKQHEFKPFDKVLVRDTNKEAWTINFFSHYSEDWGYECLDASYQQCLPYNDQTAHLLDTTDGGREVSDD